MLNYLKSFIFFYVFILGQLNPLFDLNFKILKTINLIHYLLFILFLHLTSILQFSLKETMTNLHYLFYLIYQILFRYIQMDLSHINRPYNIDNSIYYELSLYVFRKKFLISKILTYLYCIYSKYFSHHTPSILDIILVNKMYHI